MRNSRHVGPYRSRRRRPPSWKRLFFRGNHPTILSSALGAAAMVVGYGLFNPSDHSEPRSAFSSSAYYRNCAAARAAGAAPLEAGEPGFRTELDADGDGIACEPYFGHR